MGKHMWALAILLSSAAAAAAPPKGAYKIVKWIDDKSTSTPEDLFKKVEMRGEIVITFDGDKVSAGTWGLMKDVDDRKRDVMYVTACRGEATGPVKWTGDTFNLDAPIEFKGYVNGYVFTTTKKGKGKDHKADLFTHTMSCGYKLEEPSYKVTGSGDKIVLTTPKGEQIVLERTTPIADVNPKAMANKYWDE
jgi:hypothetical protein